MKRIFLFVVAVSIATLSNAQSIGLKAGMNLANQKIKNVDGNNMLVGYQFGAILTMPVGPLELEANLLLSSKGTKFDIEVPIVGKITTKINPLYIDIPVKINYVLDLSGTGLFVGVGPTFSYGIAGKIKTTVDDTEKEEKIKWGDKKVEDLYKPFDLGIGIQAGAKLIDKIRVAVSYDIGMSNIATTDKILDFNVGEVKNNVLTFSVAYMF